MVMLANLDPHWGDDLGNYVTVDTIDSPNRQRSPMIFNTCPNATIEVTLAR